MKLVPFSLNLVLGFLCFGSCPLEPRHRYISPLLAELSRFESPNMELCRSLSFTFIKKVSFYKFVETLLNHAPNHTRSIFVFISIFL